MSNGNDDGRLRTPLGILAFYAEAARGSKTKRAASSSRPRRAAESGSEESGKEKADEESRETPATV